MPIVSRLQFSFSLGRSTSTSEDRLWRRTARAPAAKRSRVTYVVYTNLSLNSIIRFRIRVIAFHVHRFVSCKENETIRTTQVLDFERILTTTFLRGFSGNDFSTGRNGPVVTTPRTTKVFDRVGIFENAPNRLKFRRVVKKRYLFPRNFERATEFRNSSVFVL